MMNKGKLGLVVGFLASAAIAQAEPIDDETCSQVFGQLANFAQVALVEPPVLARATGDDRCDIQNLGFKSELIPAMVFEAASLSINSDELADIATNGRLPGSFSINMDGLVNYVEVGHPMIDYLARTKSARKPMTLEVSFVEDSRAETLRIERARIDLGHGNRVSVTGLISGFALDGTERAWVKSFATAKVEEVSVTLDFNGMFEDYLLAPLLASVSPQVSQSPEAVFDLARQGWIDYAQNLPAPRFSPRSREALILFLQSLPHPTGRLNVDVRFHNGFGLQEAQDLGARQLSDPFSTHLAAATYEVDFDQKAP